MHRDVARRPVGDGDRRVRHSVRQQQIIAQRVIPRAADLRHVDHRRDLFLVLFQLLHVGILAREADRHHILIVAGEHQSLILPQHLSPRERDRNVGDRGRPLRVHDRHHVDPQTDRRKQRDRHGNELTFFHNFPPLQFWRGAGRAANASRRRSSSAHWTAAFPASAAQGAA